MDESSKAERTGTRAYGYGRRDQDAEIAARIVRGDRSAVRKRFRFAKSDTVHRYTISPAISMSVCSALGVLEEYVIMELFLPQVF